MCCAARSRKTSVGTITPDNGGERRGKAGEGQAATQRAGRGGAGRDGGSGLGAAWCEITGRLDLDLHVYFLVQSVWVFCTRGGMFYTDGRCSAEGGGQPGPAVCGRAERSMAGR